VREHIIFFSRLKGTPLRAAEAECDRLLESFHLTERQARSSDGVCRVRMDRLNNDEGLTYPPRGARGDLNLAIMCRVIRIDRLDNDEERFHLTDREAVYR
jgi:hypothetical protein